jgi:hypothetical protein
VRGAVFLLFLFFSISQGQIIEIHQLNVDQGDACFIRADTFKIFIDGGKCYEGKQYHQPVFDQPSESANSISPLQATTTPTTSAV